MYFKLYLIVALLFSFGCATTAPKFAALEKPVEGKAKLYFYRETALKGAGVSCNIFDAISKSSLVDLGSGKFFHLDVPAESQTYWVQQIFGKLLGKENVRISLQEGETGFIKCSIKSSPEGGIPVLTLVESDVAMEELKQCQPIVTIK